jgi:UDP-2,3-diacylglucosamine hydrolase
MIALFAGTGALPDIIATRAGDRLAVVCQMAGFPAVVPDRIPLITYRLENLGTLLDRLQVMGVTHVCMAGALRRPVIDGGLVDPVTAPLLALLEPALAQGDDGTLRAVIGLFEGQGFTVLAASDLAPDLLPAAGVLTRTAPGPDAAQDAKAGQDTVARMGRADQGQACIVRRGHTIAEESAAGTDAMLAALPRGAAPDDGRDWPLSVATDLIGQAAVWLSGDAPRSGILFKAPKPGQDRRADLPVIGPGTADAVIGAGLAGIVIETGGVMVLDRAATVARLDAAGLFLWVRDRT